MNKILGKNFNWAKPNHPIEKISLEIKDVPVYMGCVDNTFNSKDDYIADIIFGVCPHTGTIQSMNRMPLDKVYLKPHNACIGKVWEEHNNSFAKFIINRLPKDAIVYEIGGGDGYLAYICIKHVKEWHCIEPNIPDTHFTHSKLIYHTGGYYPEIPIRNADVVVHSHVLEHIRSPKRFFRDLVTPIQLFSVPNFDLGMISGNPSILNFEHENALSKEVLDEILYNSGYSVFSENYNTFSLFYEARRLNAFMKTFREPKVFDYKKSLDLLIQYGYKLRRQATILEDKIKIKMDDSIFFFGAHIFYTMLRSCGLTTKFTGLIDNSPLKVGKRLYGTEYIVQQPNIIKDLDKSVIVVPYTPYQFEMIKQIQTLNDKTKIIYMENIL